MRPELHHIERVEKYLNGDLNKAELTAFENEMARSVELQEIVAAQQLVQQAAMRKAIRADVLKYGAEASSSWGSWRNLSAWTLFNWLSFIGGVALLLGVLVGSGFWQLENSKDSKATYQQSNKQISLIDTVFSKSSIPKYSSTDLMSLNTMVVDSLKGNPEYSLVDEEKDSPSSEPEDLAITYKEDTYCGGLNSWVKPEQQYFKISPKKGATIEGKEGTLIIVPSDAFVSDEGVLIEKTVELELVEALEMSEMVAYNLVTMADGRALTSGGMIYVQPTVDGKKVNINPNRPLYIEIPTNDFNPDMKSWEGKIDSLGDINWGNPKPLKKYLTKIDFDNLDFLPKGFNQAVANGMPFKSYKTATDFLVDSLYYNMQLIGEAGVSDSLFGRDSFPYSSKIKKRLKEPFISLKVGAMDVFGRKYLKGNSVLVGTVTDESGSIVKGASITIFQNGYSNKKAIITNNKGVFYFDKAEAGDVMLTATLRRKTGFVMEGLIAPTGGKGDTIKLKTSIVLKESTLAAGNGLFNNVGRKSREESFDLETATECYINPQSIKTIKSENFANTFLATKEFEQRLAILHQMPNAQKLFDIYVNNLESDLWIADEKVAALLQGSDRAYFTTFAKEKLTNVENSGIYQKQLSAYYNEKKKENIAITKALQEEYAKKSTAELIKEQAKLNTIIKEYNSLSTDNNKSVNVLSSSSFSSLESNNNSNASNNLRNKRPKKRNKTSKTSSKSPFEKSVISSKSTYATTWFQTGWMNIDAYIHALGINPITVSINGGLDIEDKKGKVRTRIYQCLNTIHVVIPLVVIDKVAKAKFPNKKSKHGKTMRNTYCIGLRNQGGNLEIAYRNYSPYQSDKVMLTWQKIEQDELVARLKSLPGFNSGLIDIVKAENAALLEAIVEEQKRKEIALKRAEFQKSINIQNDKVQKLQKNLDAENAFIKTLLKVVDKCGVAKDPVLIPSINVIRETPIQRKSKTNGVQVATSSNPMFVGGEQAMFDFLKRNIRYPKKALDEGLGGTVYVQFDVAITGEVVNIKTVKDTHKLLDKEAVRVVSMMPNWTPAIEAGQKVQKTMTIPIRFSAH